MRLFRGYFIAAALFACASPALSGCALSDIKPPGSPSEVADLTTADEKALLGLELGYQAARMAGEALVDVGVIKGAVATKVREVDEKVAYWLEIARGAYDAGNATTYKMAMGYAEPALKELLGVFGKGKSP